MNTEREPNTAFELVEAGRAMLAIVYSKLLFPDNEDACSINDQEAELNLCIALNHIQLATHHLGLCAHKLNKQST